MTGLVPPDRWTCPECHRTEVPHDTGNDAALALALRLIQTQHAERHRAARGEAARLRRAR